MAYYKVPSGGGSLVKKAYTTVPPHTLSTCSRQRETRRAEATVGNRSSKQ